MSSIPCETKQPLPLNREYPRLPPELVREVICHIPDVSDSFLDLFACSLVCTIWNAEARQRLAENTFFHLFHHGATTATYIRRMAELLKEAHKYGLHYHTLIERMEIRLTPGFPKQGLEGYVTILALCPPNLSKLNIRLESGSSCIPNKAINAFFDRIKNITPLPITSLKIHGSDNLRSVASFISSHSTTLSELSLRSISLDGAMISALRLCTQLRVLTVRSVEEDDLFSLFSSWPELRSFQYYRYDTHRRVTEIADALRKLCPYLTDIKYVWPPIL